MILVTLDAARVKIDHVNGAAEVNAPYVRPNVGRFLRPVLAVRTLKPRQLAALVLQVLLKIVLPVEDAAAIRTGELDVLYVLQSERRRRVPFAH